MVRPVLIYIFLISTQLTYAQIAMSFAIDQNKYALKPVVDCSQETSFDCMKKAQEILESSGYTKYTNFYGHDGNEFGLKSGHYVILVSTWTSADGKSNKTYGFGVGGTHAIAEENAVKGLGITGAGWRSEYGYKQYEAKIFMNSFVKETVDNKEEENKSASQNQQGDQSTDNNRENTDKPNNTNSEETDNPNTDNPNNSDRSKLPNDQERNDYDPDKDLNDKRQKLYDESQKGLEQMQKDFETRQRIFEDGLSDLAQGIASGDRYTRTGAATIGTVKVLAGMGLDPTTAFAGGIAAWAISALWKTDAEKEAEENKKIFDEYITIVKIADKKLLKAEQNDVYDYNLYMNARNEYNKVVANKYAGDYPSGMISKIDYLIETERIKQVMIKYTDEFINDFDKNYFSESGEAIYFYFVTIKTDVANRTTYLKMSNIFPVYYDHINKRWPYMPEITNKIKLKYPNTYLKGYFRSKLDAQKKRALTIEEAKKNYFKSEVDVYKFSFNTQQYPVNDDSKTDFWGNEKESKTNTTNGTNTDFWGNEVKTNQDTLKTNKPKQEKEVKKGEVDFWGNPVKQ